MLLDGVALLIGARGDTHRKPRVIVQYRQWMATPLTQAEMALEVHLPEIVGRFMLEPDKRFDLSSLGSTRE